LFVILGHGKESRPTRAIFFFFSLAILGGHFLGNELVTHP